MKRKQLAALGLAIVMAVGTVGHIGHHCYGCRDTDSRYWKRKKKVRMLKLSLRHRKISLHHSKKNNKHSSRWSEKSKISNR